MGVLLRGILGDAATGGARRGIDGLDLRAVSDSMPVASTRSYIAQGRSVVAAIAVSRLGRWSVPHRGDARHRHGNAAETAVLPGDEPSESR